MYNCIITAIENDYQAEQNGRTVVGYNSMNYDNWVRKWKARFFICMRFQIRVL